MKTSCSVFNFLFLCWYAALAQPATPTLSTADIDHFWQAYDKIVATSDSAARYAYLNDDFISKRTPGLKAIMQVRGYTPQSYIQAIEQYPQFWKSIRPAMATIPTYTDAIALNIEKLKKLYPHLKPATIYFTVGAFRTGGTTMDSRVLIGSEIAMADSGTNTTELAKSMPALAAYLHTSPVKNLVFNNVHEYVHTQQITTVSGTLAGQCLLEGVAEFVAEKATGKASTIPAIVYGLAHENEVKKLFATYLFNRSTGYWMYSNDKNPFGLRDMGYYVGYAICQAYYNRSGNKKQAIQSMIELNYDNVDTLSRFIDQSRYLNTPVVRLREQFEKSRPNVTGVSPLGDSLSMVNPTFTRLTIHFSTPMDKRYRNFDFGPLRKDFLMRVQHFVGFSEDGTAATIEVLLKPAQRYQLLLGEGFRRVDGVPLKPYLIDFTIK